MKLCYMIDIDSYEEKFPCSRKEKFFDMVYKFFFKERKIKGPFPIKNSSFKNIGDIFLVDFNDLLSERNVKILNNYLNEEKGIICLPRNYDLSKLKYFNIKYICDDEIFFNALFSKMKKMVDDIENTQIGVCLDKNTNYEYVKMICEYLPLVIFFVNNHYLGENISSNILKDTGSSIYVSKSIESMKKCEYIFDLSKEIFSDKINKIECNNYFSIYKKNEFYNCKRIINDAKIIPLNYKIEKINLKYFDLSFVEGLLYIDNKIKDKKDIFNIDLDEYLKKKSLKMLYFNGL